MAFNTSSTGSFVPAAIGAEIITKSLNEGKTIKELIASGNVQYGVKGSREFLKKNSTVVLTDGTTCGRTLGSTTNLGSVTLTVKRIHNNEDLCPADLDNKYFSYTVNEGKTPSEELIPAFAEFLLTDRAKELDYENEKLIWQGNTSLTGSTNLKWLDGIVVQLSGNSVFTAVGSTLVEKYQSIVLTASTAVSTQKDFRVCIGEDAYAQYKVAVANKNLFNENDPNEIYGTTAKFHVCSGLNGTGKAIATRWSNLQYGEDGASNAGSMWYSQDDDNFKMSFKYAIGIKVIDATEVTVATV